MDREETKFLIVNVKSLWNEGMLEEGKIVVSDKGVSLSTESSYVNAGSIPVEFAPIDFAIDRCGVLYLINSDKEIVVFDKNENTYYLIKCITLTDPRHITISDSDIYVVDGDRLLCLARVNYQTRWEKPVEKIENFHLVDIAFCKVMPLS